MLKKVVGHDEHPRRAVTALQRTMLGEELLKPAEDAALGQAFDRIDPGAVGLNREHETGSSSLPIEEYGACAANAVLAAHMRAGEPQVLAQEVAQQKSRLDLAFVRLAIDRQADLANFRHVLSPTAVLAACPATRRTRLATIRRRYSASAWRSLLGSTDAAAADAAI